MRTFIGTHTAVLHQNEIHVHEETDYIVYIVYNNRADIKSKRDYNFGHFSFRRPLRV